jgi:hypothetical protein
MGAGGWNAKGLSPFLSGRARSRAPQVLSYAAVTGAAMLVSPGGEVVLFSGTAAEVDVERIVRVAAALGGASAVTSFAEGTTCVHAAPVCMGWMPASCQRWARTQARSSNDCAVRAWFSRWLLSMASRQVQEGDILALTARRPRSSPPGFRRAETNDGSRGRRREQLPRDLVREAVARLQWPARRLRKMKGDVEEGPVVDVHIEHARELDHRADDLAIRGLAEGHGLHCSFFFSDGFFANPETAQHFGESVAQPWNERARRSRLDDNGQERAL